MKELVTVRIDCDIKDQLLGDVENVRDDLALLIPKHNDEPYVKSTTEAAVNTMWRMTTALRPNKSKVPFDELYTGKTDDGIHENLMIITKDVANLMQKIVHSASWRDGMFYDFDTAEFKRLLTNIAARL
jgi:hypothetical protein